MAVGLLLLLLPLLLASVAFPSPSFGLDSNEIPSLVVAQLQEQNFLLDGYFRDFKERHGRTYSSAEEEEERKAQFGANLERVLEHNKAADRGEHSYHKDPLGPFADMSPPEARARTAGCFRADLLDSNGGSKSGELTERDLETAKLLKYLSRSAAGPHHHVDWREKGAVTEVKDQGECGSCWAFSATGALEGQWAIHKGKRVDLSEQQILDCTTGKPYQMLGCYGGLPSAAFQYMHDKGSEGETDYPYRAKTGDNCHFNSSDVLASDLGFTRIPFGDEEALRAAVALVGPVSVVLDAEHFADYKSGVFHDDSCCPAVAEIQCLSHAVLVVGYGTDPVHGEYWIIKNSWGKKWGEDGYMRFSRNKGNMCGIASMAMYPVVG